MSEVEQPTTQKINVNNYIAANILQVDLQIDNLNLEIAMKKQNRINAIKQVMDWIEAGQLPANELPEDFYIKFKEYSTDPRIDTHITTT